MTLAPSLSGPQFPSREKGATALPLVLQVKDLQAEQVLGKGEALLLWLLLKEKQGPGGRRGAENGS